MTDETSKTRAVRGSEFEQRFLKGRVIDIGCGPDPIVSHAEPFDLQHGDAQMIGSLRPREAYDAVCSSHCLEHMKDVPGALAQWWQLVKAGGYLILVVPDEDLYEQGGWPSIFNYDHKATFRLGTTTTWSPVSYDILSLVENLPGAEIISHERQDQGYDYSKQRRRISRKDRVLFRLQRLSSGFLRRFGHVGSKLIQGLKPVFVYVGTPIDQTSGAALAQIQVVARKRRSIEADAAAPPAQPAHRFG